MYVSILLYICSTQVLDFSYAHKRTQLKLEEGRDGAEYPYPKRLIGEFVITAQFRLNQSIFSRRKDLNSALKEGKGRAALLPSSSYSYA